VGWSKKTTRDRALFQRRVAFVLATLIHALRSYALVHLDGLVSVQPRDALARGCSVIGSKEIWPIVVVVLVPQAPTPIAGGVTVFVDDLRLDKETVRVNSFVFAPVSVIPILELINTDCVALTDDKVLRWAHAILAHHLLRVLELRVACASIRVACRVPISVDSTKCGDSNLVSCREGKEGGWVHGGSVRPRGWRGHKMGVIRVLVAMASEAGVVGGQISRWVLDQAHEMRPATLVVLDLIAARLHALTQTFVVRLGSLECETLLTHIRDLLVCDAEPDLGPVAVVIV